MPIELKFKQLGRYQITDVLGQGAMAVVYKAVDARIDRTVAIKTLQIRPGMTDEQIKEFRDRFVHEAKISGKLLHPNIVAIYDAEDDSDISYMAMEYVEGPSLEEIIDQKTEMPLEQILGIMIQICDGLGYAHKQGIIHRDIKPGNIILTKDGVAKITDFGIAKVMASTTTVLGMILGTPGYMSPEQITGKPVDHRTDIFSLGTLFYELLTGEQAFPGKNITEIMYRVVNENPLPPNIVNADLPAGFNNLIMKSLIKNPNERYQSAEEFARFLKRAREATTGGTSKTEFLENGDFPFTISGFVNKGKSIFGNRIFSIGSFVWAFAATIAFVVLLFNRPKEYSRIAKELSVEKSTSLWISTNVPDATVIIDRQHFKTTGSIFQLDSIGVGEHRISIQRENYSTYETALIIGKGEFKRIESKLKLLPVEIPAGVDTSYFSIGSIPEMVKVETSYGKFLGYTPIDTLAFPSGKYTLLFTKDDYVSKRKDLSLRKNKIARIDLALEKQRGSVSLEKVFPEEAALYIGKKAVYRNSRANRYSVEVGEQAVVIRADGYEDVEKKVIVKNDETVILTDSLKAVYGSVWINSNPSGAELYLDGSDGAVGNAPMQIDHVLASNHRLKAVYKNEKRLVNYKIEKNDTARVNVVFSYPNGFLEMKTDPPGADIYLNTADDDSKTPSRKEVKPGYYKIRLVHPKFKKFYEMTLKVRPEQTTRVEYKFEE